MAGLGLGSRREIETWIAEGRIRVNGETAKLGDRVEPSDRVSVDGRAVHLAIGAPDRSRVLMYHKPVGEVCTRKDPEGRPSVFDRLPALRRGRWILVGRLDFNTSGLLLLTNEGDLAHRLMHPSSEIEREYAVRILGEVDEDMLKRMQEGVELEDGQAAFDSVRDAGGTGVNHWYHVILREGRRREVRRIWESQGVRVSRLIRLRYGNISLPRGLADGRFRDLDEVELGELMASVGMSPTVVEKQHRRQGATYRPRTPEAKPGKKRVKGGSVNPRAAAGPKEGRRRPR